MEEQKTLISALVSGKGVYFTTKSDTGILFSAKSVNSELLQSFIKEKGLKLYLVAFEGYGVSKYLSYSSEVISSLIDLAEKPIILLFDGWCKDVTVGRYFNDVLFVRSLFDESIKTLFTRFNDPLLFVECRINTSSGSIIDLNVGSKNTFVGIESLCGVIQFFKDGSMKVIKT